MKIEDVLGEYSISGTNQDDSNQSYRGTLKLTLDSEKRIFAKWLINNHQTQIGSGFLKDNILEINFKYEDEHSKICKGVVVYKCLSENVLDGYWFEEFGDPEYLGAERCFRIDSQKKQLD